MATFKRKDSQYWFIQFMLNGKTYAKSSRSTNKKVAERMEAEWRTKIHAREYLGEKESVTIERAFELFLDTKQNSSQHYNYGTQVRVLSKYLNLGKLFENLSSADIERFKASRQNEGIKQGSIVKAFQIIKSTVSTIDRLGYKTPNLSFPKLDKYVPRTRYLSTEEESKLLTELDPNRTWSHSGDVVRERTYRDRKDNYDIVCLLLDTGARWSEITHLRWQQIDLTTRTISLWRPKTRTHTLIRMTDRVFYILSNRKNDSEIVFAREDGRAKSNNKAAIVRALKRAGLSDFTVHDLRHTAASRLIQAGMTLYEVAYVLGHSNPHTTTVLYGHLDKADVAERAADILNKMNEGRSPRLKAV